MEEDQLIKTLEEAEQHNIESKKFAL